MADAFDTGFQGDGDAFQAVPGYVPFDNTFNSDTFDADGGVGVDLGINYRIAAPVSVDLAVDYRIGIEPVSVDLETDYRIEAQVYADLGTDYRIHVGVFVDADKTVDYHIYAFVGASLETDYQVVSTVGAELIVDYFLNPFAWAALDVNYKILATGPQKDLTVDYRITDKAGASLETDYQIAGSLIAHADLTVNYAIDAIRDVVVRYDGIDITEHLIYRECEFISQTNGSVGTASVLLRDSEFTASFTTGRPLELYINGQLLWSGFVAKVGREYPFSYEDLQTNVQKLPRYIRLQASDINILFERRYTVNLATPTKVEGPTFTADNTPDVDAIRQLCDAWLDLSGDDIDTVSMVEHVGNINVDQPANPFQAGQTWKEAMYQIASLPAAVFYITPDRKLVYTDVDTVTNPMVLSDQPDNPALDGHGIGYRQAHWEALGERLCNDYLAWGVAQQPIVFRRLESDASIATHGRWQDSVVNYSVYKQATINKIADRQINGSPGSRRGHKDDRNVFTCTTYTPGFSVAQKVRVISETYDYDDVLPIRRMRISFPSPTAPRYDLTLTHEIDVFGFFDVIRYHWPPREPLPPWPPPPKPPEPPDPVCTVLDSFNNRTTNYTWDRDVQNSGVTGGWGSGEQLTWTTWGTQLYVGGGAGVIDAREPMWPAPYSFGGGTIGAQATIPAGIPSNNVVIKWGLGRLNRILPGGAATTTIDTVVAGFGPAQWFDIPNGYDYDENALDGYGMQAHWSTRAYVPAMVRSAAVTASFSLTSMFGPITKTLFRGSTPNYGFAADGHGGQWHPNGAGFYPGVALWGNSGGEADGALALEWLAPDGGGWGQYWGGLDLVDYQFAGPDSPAYIFNQAVGVTFTIGSQSITVGKGHGIFGLTGDGISGQPFGVSTNSGGPFGDDLAKVVEPGFYYFMRWWRPNGNNSYVKLWESWADEPDEWQAYNGDQPPYIYDLNGDRHDWPAGHPTDEPPGAQGISIAAQVFTMDQYSVIVDGIWACTEVNDTTEIPIQKPQLPHGSSYTEHFASVTAESGVHTIVPYIPGSLILSVNGTMQRKGVDYVEADPTKGTFTLLFTPDTGDKVTVRYLVA